MSSSFVTTDDRTLAYRRFGSGPLLVCQCGGPGFPGANSRRVVLEDSGHFTWVDAPEQFRDEVGRFLAA